MADRIFERILNQAGADAEATQEQQDPELQRRKAQKNEESELRKLLLELPPPEVDALGAPTWPVTAAEVSKAYRKLSVLVHPDKNPGEAARQAFEALNEAHRELKDQSKLEGILKEHLEAAQKRADEALASATLEERLVMQAQQAQQAKALRKAQGESFQAEVTRQMRERQEAAKRKRDAAEKSRYRRQEEEEAARQRQQEEEEQRRQQQQQQQQQADGSSDDEDAAARRRALAKKRQRQRKPSGM
ncbi:Chaperone protein DnaJ [Chlorella vulgaris]